MEDRAPAANRRALTVGLVLTVSITAFEALAVATILPATVREIGGLGLYGWAFTGFMLANLAGLPVAGRAADRRGPALPFVGGVALFSGGLGVAGFAPSMEVLVAGRVLQGAGAAALSGVAYVVVARAYPADEQPRMMALLSSAWVVPGLFGPALAAGIAEQAGWRFVFLGLVPATLVAGGIALPALQRLGAPAQGASASQAKGAVRDALLLATGVALALLGVRSEHVAGIAAFGAGGALLAGSALLRLLPAGTMRARAGLPAAVAVLALVNFAFFSVEAFFPLALTEVHGAGTGFIAASLTAGTLAWTTGSWLQARAAGRITRRSLLRAGLVLLLLGLTAAAAVLSPAVPPLAGVPAWALAGFGIGIAYPVTTLAVFDAAPPGREGEVTATMQIANALAIALGTGLGGDLVARVVAAGQPAALGIGGVNCLALGVMVLALLAAPRVPEARRAQRIS